MKQILLTLFFITISAAQQPGRTIDVKGTGTYSAIPDRGVLSVEITAVQRQFGDAVKELNSKTEKINAQLFSLGFSTEEIKTGDYTVAKHTVWENNANVDKGYIARQRVTVEFPQSKEKIGTIITSFMKSGTDVQFSFHFILSESKERMVRDELLKRTVADAHSRASVLTAAAGEKLGKVIRISYGNATPVMPMQYAMKSAQAFDAERSVGFEVKEISLTDDVTIVWELKE
jgi:hypothetical protein